MTFFSLPLNTSLLFSLMSIYYFCDKKKKKKGVLLKIAEKEMCTLCTIKCGPWSTVLREGSLKARWAQRCGCVLVHFEAGRGEKGRALGGEGCGRR